MDLREYKIALKEQKEKTIYSIKSKAKLMGIGLSLSFLLVLGDGLTYINKAKNLTNNPEIKEVLAIKNEEQRSKELNTIFKEKGYYKKLERKLERSENIFTAASAMTGVSLSYLIFGSLFSLGNYQTRKRNLQDRLDRRNLPTY